jgi:hypothetical protein
VSKEVDLNHTLLFCLLKLYHWQFYTSTVAVRRRLERKWHETPLAAVFSIDDEWLLFKQRSQVLCVF